LEEREWNTIPWGINLAGELSIAAHDNCSVISCSTESFRLSRNDAVAFGERGRLDRCFRRLAENLGSIRILTEW
jgi:hypothetical protein